MHTGVRPNLISNAETQALPIGQGFETPRTWTPNLAIDTEGKKDLQSANSSSFPG